MKSNTVGHIYVEYSTGHHNQTVNLGPMDVYDANLTNHVPLHLTDLSVIPNRTSITLDSNSTIVDYTVTAKNNLNGIYALPVEHFTDRSSVVGKVPWNATIRSYSKAFCDMIPLVIGLNNSQVNQDALDKFNFLNTSENCPVPLVDRWYYGSQTIEIMPGTHMTGVKPIDASMDKDVYFPGDIATVRGYLYTNDTNVTIGLERDHSVIVESKNVPVMQNRTFVSSFIIPTNYANTWSVMVSSKSADGLALYPNFESLPLKQYKAGIDAKNVVCKQEYQLILRSEDSSPACVKPDTAQKLVERGWGTIINFANQPANSTPLPNSIKVPNTNFTVNYDINGGDVIGVRADLLSKSIIFSIQTISDGKMTLDLPRAMIDAKTQGQDDKFMILADGQENDYKEIKTTMTDRTITIPFTNGIQEIEIIAGTVLSGH